MFESLKTIIGLLYLFGLRINSYTSWSTEEGGMVDLQYNLLLGCLISVGVNRENIHHRNSGPAYDELNWQWNSLNGYQKPLAYLVATEVSDIQKAIDCCRLSKVRIVARSGGHSYVKLAFGDSRSLIVDLTKLSQILVDPMQMTCEIGAGAQIGHIFSTLWKNGKFLISSGICPNVGIAGLTLGGGMGRFTTALGLSSDNVIEMEMVDARGQLLVINNSTNSDLFWALRGGGGGNFGIVTKFKFKMYAAPRSIINIQNEYSFEDFSQFFSAWQKLLTFGIPKHFHFVFKLKNDRIFMTLFAFNFQHKNETVKSLKSFLNLFSFPITTNSTARLMSYTELMVKDAEQFSSAKLENISQLENLTKHDAVVGWKKVKSIYVDRILNATEISKLKELLPDYLQYSNLTAEPCVGAINSLLPSDTAFVHRGKNLFLFQLNVFTAPNEPPNLKADRAMTTFYEKSKCVLHHRESYQNYMDQDITDYLTRYYGANLHRLISIKKRFDPGNVFHHPQSIPVNFDFSGK